MELEQTVTETTETKPTKTMAQLTRAERDELNALSKDLFGASSRWQRLITQGHARVVTEEVTELVPGATDEEPSTERKVQVPVKMSNGAIRSQMFYHTVDSVRELMLEMKARREAYLEMVKKLQAEQKAKQEQEELEKKVQEDVAGSAGR